MRVISDRGPTCGTTPSDNRTDNPVSMPVLSETAHLPPPQRLHVHAPAASRGLVSAYDLTCRTRYDLTCRSAHGDGPGTRALIEVLLLHRHAAHADVVAGITSALAAGSTSPQLVAIA